MHPQRLAEGTVAGGDIAHRVFQHLKRVGDRHQRIGENDDGVGGFRQAHAIIEQQEETGGQHDARHGEDQHAAQLKRLTGERATAGAELTAAPQQHHGQDDA